MAQLGVDSALQCQQGLREGASLAIDVEQLTETFVTREKQVGLRGSVRALFRPVHLKTQVVKAISFTVAKGEPGEIRFSK